GYRALNRAAPSELSDSREPREFIGLLIGLRERKLIMRPTAFTSSDRAEPGSRATPSAAGRLRRAGPRHPRSDQPAVSADSCARPRRTPGSAALAGLPAGP